MPLIIDTTSNMVITENDKIIVTAMKLDSKQVFNEDAAIAITPGNFAIVRLTDTSGVFSCVVDQVLEYFVSKDDPSMISRLRLAVIMVGDSKPVSVTVLDDVQIANVFQYGDLLAVRFTGGFSAILEDQHRWKAFVSTYGQVSYLGSLYHMVHRVDDNGVYCGWQEQININTDGEGVDVSTTGMMIFYTNALVHNEKKLSYFTDAIRKELYNE